MKRNFAWAYLSYDPIQLFGKREMTPPGGLFVFPSPPRRAPPPARRRLNPKIVKGFARSKLCGQPAWQLPASGPSFGWSLGVFEFRKHPRIGSPSGAYASAIGASYLFELAKAPLEARFFNGDLFCESRRDFFMESPQLVTGH
jgi:hypothetical protein